MADTYPQILITPNLKLDCTGLGVVQATNMFIIDSTIGPEITGDNDSLLLMPVADQVIIGPFALSLNGGWLSIVPNVFSTLPAPSSMTAGSLATINDSDTNTWGAVISGGGTFTVLTFCNGVSWTVAAI